MDNRQATSRKIRFIAGMAIFTALVVLLQLLGSFIRIGPFSVSLVLIPIVVGAAVYGPGAGAFLGFVFGAVVLAACIGGADVGGYILWSASPVITALLCIVKGAAAGWAAGAVYALISQKRKVLAIFTAAIVCPVVNTGIFCVSMLVFFRDILTEWAGGTPIIYYTFIGLVGINFLLELLFNIILSPAVVQIIRAAEKTRKQA